MFISGYSDLGNPEGWNPLAATTSRSRSTRMQAGRRVSTTSGSLRLPPPLDEALAAGARRRSARGIHVRSRVTALNPEALDATVGFQDGTPRSRTTGMASRDFSRHPALGEEQPVHKMTSFENQFALHPRPLAARRQADARSGPALGALSQPDARGRPRHRVVRSQTNEALIGGRGTFPGQRRGLQQEALRSPHRVHLSVERRDSRPERLRDHYHSHPWGAQALARLVSADARRILPMASTAISR